MDIAGLMAQLKGGGGGQSPLAQLLSTGGPTPNMPNGPDPTFGGGFRPANGVGVGDQQFNLDPDWMGQWNPNDFRNKVGAGAGGGPGGSTGGNTPGFLGALERRLGAGSIGAGINAASAPQRAGMESSPLVKAIINRLMVGNNPADINAASAPARAGMDLPGPEQSTPIMMAVMRALGNSPRVGGGRPI